MMSYYEWAPYVPVAERRRQAASKLAKLKKKGEVAAPVTIEGRIIAKSFWGKAWCANLERYSDSANRLPRGRTYVRNGSVVDLQVDGGGVKALVIETNRGTWEGHVRNLLHWCRLFILRWSCCSRPAEHRNQSC